MEPAVIVHGDSMIIQNSFKTRMVADLFLSGTGGPADWRKQNDEALTLNVLHYLRAGHK
jgi:hypothetical protein